MPRSRYIEDMAPDLKGRASELPPAPAAADSLSYQAILFPNRSLPNAGFVAVMTVLIAYNLTLGVGLYIIGAWPVIGFCGLDVFLVWLAFKLSYRQGRLHERVRITPDEMLVSRVLPSGHETRWKLQPFWTDVRIDRPVEHETQLRVISKGRTLILGAFLSPAERGAFADALAAALSNLKRA
jgi:uncharacterized membrane protein